MAYTRQHNRYLYQAMKGNNDGLMQRLQLAVYPDELSNWQLIDTKPNKAEKDRAYHIMQTLAELDFVHYGAVQGDYDDRPYFHFDEQGQAVFNQWCATCKPSNFNKKTTTR